MSLIRILCLSTRSKDANIAVVADETVYGAPNLNRNQEAHFMVIAKMDENEVLAFITGIDNTLPLASLSWQFNETVDGAYRFIQFNPLFYSGATHYAGETKDSAGVILTYADIVWEASTAKFYKAIHADFIGIQPGVTGGWATYWQVSPDFTLEVSNNKVDKFISDDIITFRYEDCLVEALDCVNDDILCGVCNNFDGLFKPLSMMLQLEGFNSLNWQDKQTKAEVDIVESTKKFCC